MTELDSTVAMLERIKGARIIRNQENLGFGPRCMLAVDAATGEYHWFFNNDALLTDNGIEAALGNFDTPGVGAVDGKIRLADGRLQEVRSSGAMATPWATGAATIPKSLSTTFDVRWTTAPPCS